jgi:hypothetical protein
MNSEKQSGIRGECRDRSEWEEEEESGGRNRRRNLNNNVSFVYVRGCVYVCTCIGCAVYERENVCIAVGACTVWTNTS